MSTAANDLFARLDLPVWLVTARSGLRRGGLIATCVSQASIVAELPRVVVGLARQHFTWELVQASRSFAVHLLSTEDFPLVERFGLACGREGDKFAGLRVEEGTTGSPLLPQALGWLDCRVEEALESGDRTFYLAEVVAARVRADGVPLTTRSMIEQASPSMRRQLKEQLERDAAVDARAIAAWREARRTASAS